MLPTTDFSFATRAAHEIHDQADLVLLDIDSNCEVKAMQARFLAISQYAARALQILDQHSKSHDTTYAA